MITPTSVKTSSEHRFFVHGSLEFESKALVQLFTLLGKKKFSIINSNSINDMEIIQNIEKAGGEQLIPSIVYDPGFAFNNIKLQFKRLIKTKGVKKVIIWEKAHP